MKKKQVLPEALYASTQVPPILPTIGKLRWSKIKPFAPYSYETFRKYSLEGRAPQPERMNIRCTLYDAYEVHRWLADPIGYTVTKED